jgi:hypothetical protein
VLPAAGLDVMAKRKILCPCHESNPGRPSHTLVAIPTELSRLLHNSDGLPNIIYVQSILCLVIFHIET